MGRFALPPQPQERYGPYPTLVNVTCYCYWHDGKKYFKNTPNETLCSTCLHWQGFYDEQYAAVCKHQGVFASTRGLFGFTGVDYEKGRLHFQRLCATEGQYLYFQAGNRSGSDEESV